MKFSCFYSYFHKPSRRVLCLAMLPLAAGLWFQTGGSAQPPATALTPVAQIQEDAKALQSHFNQKVTAAFLQATSELPEVKPRTLLRDPATKKLYTQAAADKLEASQRQALVPLSLDGSFYYNTKYGSPLAYARLLEILGETGTTDVAGKKILDFGYGTVGHLRLLARCGAEAVGVDVDPLLPALYSDPGDQGPLPNESGHAGRIRLIDGRFPAEKQVARAVGGGYDLILSKNTLKNGYLHPAQPVDKRLLVDLGVEETAFVRALYAALKPGGKALIYNLSPAPSKPGEPYISWADGRCPFPITMLEAAGFQVLAFDRNDDKAARAMARILGWDTGPGAMNLENNLFGQYTLLQKPARS